jgi:hypothetical protein
MTDPFTKLFAQMIASSQEMARAFNPALENIDMRALEKLVPVMTGGKSAPPRASGSAVRMVIGCRKSWNSSTSTA